MTAPDVPARSRMKVVAAAAAFLTTCVLAFAPAAAASAHDYLVVSSPAAGSTQSTPLERVSLTFNDRVLDLTGDGSSALLQVTDTADRHYETGCPTILDRTVTARVALGGAGVYTVAWQIVSADGHTVSNAITFTYQPPAGDTAAAGSTGRPACAEGAGKTASSRATTEPAQSTAASSDGGRLTLVIGIAITIVVLALIGVLVVVLTGRRRMERPTRSDED